jgi:hypothetical protein
LKTPERKFLATELVELKSAAAEMSWWDLAKITKGKMWLGNRKKPIQIVTIAYFSTFFFKL